MNQNKYVFAGNRASVFAKMRELKLEITKIYAVQGSYLECYLKSRDIEYEVINNKKMLVQGLMEAEFDYFVSNGLPIILPISELKKGNNKQFINIHPSYLPELRGADPVPGALLYHRDAGATCHYMDEGIDTGEIIAQIKIDYSDDLDAGLLYQLSFISEAEVFEKACSMDFKGGRKQEIGSSEIYYSFHESDLEINIAEDSIQKIVGKIKAFSTKSKGAFFYLNHRKIRCSDVQILKNQFANSLIDKYHEFDILFEYEDTIVIKKKEKLLKIRIMEP